MAVFVRRLKGRDQENQNQTGKEASEQEKLLQYDIAVRHDHKNNKGGEKKEGRSGEGKMEEFQSHLLPSILTFRSST